MDDKRRFFENFGIMVKIDTSKKVETVKEFPMINMDPGLDSEIEQILGGELERYEKPLFLF